MRGFEAKLSFAITPNPPGSAVSLAHESLHIMNPLNFAPKIQGATAVHAGDGESKAREA